MSKLTSKQRKALPASEFAGAHGTYPVPDKSHAAAAKARAAQQVAAGNLTTAQQAAIDAKANQVLYGSKKAPKGRK
jgi:hypothetical protein